MCWSMLARQDSWSESLTICLMVFFIESRFFTTIVCSFSSKGVFRAFSLL